MRNRYEFVAPILDYMGALFWIFGFVLAVPLAAQLYYARAAGEAISALTFAAPAGAAFMQKTR